MSQWLFMILVCVIFENEYYNRIKHHWKHYIWRFHHFLMGGDGTEKYLSISSGRVLFIILHLRRVPISSGSVLFIILHFRKSTHLFRKRWVLFLRTLLEGHFSGGTQLAVINRLCSTGRTQPTPTHTESSFSGNIYQHLFQTGNKINFSQFMKCSIEVRMYMI